MVDENTEPVADESVDYEALYKIAQAEKSAMTVDYDKMGKDLSSLRGTVRSQNVRDAEITGRFNSMEKSIAAMGAAQASGDASTLAESLTRIGQESQADMEQRQFTEDWEESRNDMVTNLGAFTLDSPEAAEVKTLYNTAFEGKGLTDSQRLRQFNRAARLADKLVQPKAEEAKEEKGEEAEVPVDPIGTDTGPGSRGASQSLATLQAKDPRKMTPTEQKTHLAALQAEASKAMGMKIKWE